MTDICEGCKKENCHYKSLVQFAVNNICSTVDRQLTELDWRTGIKYFDVDNTVKAIKATFKCCEKE